MVLNETVQNPRENLNFSSKHDIQSCVMKQDQSDYFNCLTGVRQGEISIHYYFPYFQMIKNHFIR